MNGNQPRIAPGFLISMVGLFDIPIGIVIALVFDQFIDPTVGPILGLTVGQFVGAIMGIGGLLLFFYGRYLGWKPRDQAAPSRSDPVKRM